VALVNSVIGIILGGGVLWLLSEIGYRLMGRQSQVPDAAETLTLTPAGLQIGDSEAVPWEDMLSRRSDRIVIKGELRELSLRGSRKAPAACLGAGEFVVTDEHLVVGEHRFTGKELKHAVIVADSWVLPREVMGLGDAKLMAMLGAFLGPTAVAVIFFGAAVFGSVLGVALGLFRLAVLRKGWESRIPFGPYIALAALLYLFFGFRLLARVVLF
jgi:leader peptidase (prepilin peptidase)/N-methyltransferase